MNRIEIRGVIVPSVYDSEWAQKYIDKGIITPESTFRNALKKADTSQPLEIYINSPGGSVFSAYEMINAVREWKAGNKQTANIIVGAMAASAASMITVFVGSTVRVHKNAKMMFHGASTETYGGAGAHKDSVELLGKINAEVQQILIQKYKMSPDTVAEWFAEGRMGWLNADEMIKVGIASEIIPDDADAIVFDDAEIKAIDKQGLDIAACLEKPVEGKKDGNGKLAEGGGVNLKAPLEGGIVAPDGGQGKQPTDDAIKVAADAGIAIGRAEGEKVRAVEQARFADQLADRDVLIAKHQSAKDKAEARVLAVTAEYEGKIAALNGIIATMKDQHAAAIAQATKQADETASNFNGKIADLTKCLTDANARNSKLLGGSMTFEPAPCETWEEAMELCKGDYVTAARKYPKLRNAYNEKNKRK